MMTKLELMPLPRNNWSDKLLYGNSNSKTISLKQLCYLISNSQPCSELSMQWVWKMQLLIRIKIFLVKANVE